MADEWTAPGPDDELDTAVPYASTGAVPYVTREPEEIASFFDGLEWIEPGLVSRPLWRPDRPTDGVPVINAVPMPTSSYGGVARKR